MFTIPIWVFTIAGMRMDTKKREMIGPFKNPGARWGQAAAPVNDHDFLTDAKGVAISYGIFERQANLGHIFVGTSHDTAEFAGDLQRSREMTRVCSRKVDHLTDGSEVATLIL